ncbi:MAG: hypothetical protein O210_OD1C00001G0469 [Parcubacteria bacterium RAAC4_OD1_1]|nr:MAG: hypothetical protein O210_OD1C00001G0469 [Parcubacteria bacterium RAAC4_OD1_1]
MTTSNKILISLSLFALIGGMYLYSSNDFSIKKVYGSSFLSSIEEDFGGSSLNFEDISFISTLATLNNISIDKSLFENPMFLNLKDNKVKIESALPGRANPFAPVGIN